MADDNVILSQNAPAGEQPAVNQEVAKLMEQRLGMNQAAAPEVNNDQVVIDPPAPVVTDYFTPIKEKFGYETHEAAIKEIEELRALKAAPKPEFKFENDTSQKLYNAIQKGDRKEVYKILEQENRLEDTVAKEVTEDTAGDIIKLGMALRYKDLTPSEIEYKYNKQFALPKEPQQKADELDNEFADRKADWEERVREIKMDKVIEAKTVKPELEAAKSKITLPEFDDEEDEDYAKYRQQLEQQPKIQEEIEKAYNSFTAKTIETKIPFNDEANKIGFEFQYEPDSESYKTAVEMAKDVNKFFSSFSNQDGTPDRQKFLRTIHAAMNIDKIVMEAMKQAKNATIKSFLPDNSGGVVRQLAQQQELSEIEKQMRARGISSGQ